MNSGSWISKCLSIVSFSRDSMNCIASVVSLPDSMVNKICQSRVPLPLPQSRAPILCGTRNVSSIMEQDGRSTTATARRSGAKSWTPAKCHQEKHATSDEEEGHKRPLLLVRGGSDSQNKCSLYLVSSFYLRTVPHAREFHSAQPSS